MSPLHPLRYHVARRTIAGRTHTVRSDPATGRRFIGDTEERAFTERETLLGRGATGGTTTAWALHQNRRRHDTR